VSATTRLTGGCLCGVLRYQARGPARAMGYCCCVDCRKASGSGFIGFLAFDSAAVRITGRVLSYTSRAYNAAQAVRNSCAVCASLVFGGPLGGADGYTLYAGGLDDPALFKPTLAIFTRDLPAWVVLPQGLTRYETLPA
jgi:hypothetical protein